jgi:hypothetical protein
LGINQSNKKLNNKNVYSKNEEPSGPWIDKTDVEVEAEERADAIAQAQLEEAKINDALNAPGRIDPRT